MEINKAVDVIKHACKEKQKIKVVTHWDVDGLTSYVILKQLFDYLEADYDIEYVPVLNDETIVDLELNDYDVILFADLGSSSLHYINEAIESKNKTVVILDHHYPVNIDNLNFKIIHVNPNLCGYTGDSSACGATLSYLLAREFGLKHLAKYALIGAIGDAQSSNSGQLEDFNIIPIQDMDKNIVVTPALQIYGKFSRPLILSLKYSSNIFSNFGESDNNILAFFYKIKKDTDIDIAYHKPYCKLDKRQIQTLATYLYQYMKKFIPEQFHKYMGSCLYGHSYHMNVDTDEIISKPWSYDFEEIPSFLNASIRIEQHDLVIKYLLNGQNEKTLLSNYRKYRQKLSKAIRNFEDICTYEQMSNIQYYIAYDNEIEPTMSGVLAGMLYTKPEFDYTKPNVGIIEFEDGWKVSIRGSKLLQFTDFHAGQILMELSKRYGGSAGGHKLAAGAILPYDIDLESYLQNLNKQCSYKITR